MDILFYGDSNTYGVAPETGKRYDRGTRFKGLLQKKLNNEHNIVQKQARPQILHMGLPPKPENGMTGVQGLRDYCRKN